MDTELLSITDAAWDLPSELELVARRILLALFDEDDLPFGPATTLSDFVGERIAGGVAVDGGRAWCIAVKDRIYAHFGVHCEVDELIEVVCARIRASERNVRVTMLQ